MQCAPFSCPMSLLSSVFLFSLHEKLNSCILNSESFWPLLITESVARLSQHVRFTHDLQGKAWFQYSRYQSLSVVDGLLWSFEYLGRWESLPVVDSLSWSLTVFQSLHLNCYFWRQTYSLPVVSGLSGSLAVAKGILFCFHMT